MQKVVELESMQQLHNLVNTWHEKTGGWLKTQAVSATDMVQLEQDLHTLNRHIETLDCIQGTINALKTLHIKLNQLRKNNTTDLHCMEEEEQDKNNKEMRELNVDEYFIRNYIQFKGDYRHVFCLPSIKDMCKMIYDT